MVSPKLRAACFLVGLFAPLFFNLQKKKKKKIFLVEETHVKCIDQ